MGGHTFLITLTKKNHEQDCLHMQLFFLCLLPYWTKALSWEWIDNDSVVRRDLCLNRATMTTTAMITITETLATVAIVTPVVYWESFVIPDCSESASLPSSSSSSSSSSSAGVVDDGHNSRQNFGHNIFWQNALAASNACSPEQVHSLITVVHIVT